MGGEGTDSSKELKDETSGSHTFSVNATPFQPAVSTVPYIPPEKWQEPPPPIQEPSAVMTSGNNWLYAPQFYDMNAMLSPGMRRYSGTPIIRASSPGKKNINTTENSKRMDKGSLSVHAKPWSPTPESGINSREADTYTQLKKGWKKVPYRGEMVVAPIAFKEMTNLFVHSHIVRPLEKPGIQLELFNYLCARCATRSFFGKLSCRNADVILKGLAGDIPPLRIAHLIEQVTGVVIFALFTEGNYLEYELWLEKPDEANLLVNTICGALWSCPMFHGYAVYAKSDEAKTFLNNYITSLKEDFPEPTPYPMSCVEAIASVAGAIKG